MFATKKFFPFLMLLLCTPAAFCADQPKTFDPLKKLQLQLLEELIQEELRKVQCAEIGYVPSGLEITMRKWYENRPY